MKWIKDNLLAVILLGMFVLLMGGMLWLQQQANAKRAELESSLQSQMAEYKQLSATKPVPARDNLEILQANQKLTKEKFEQLLAAVGRGGVVNVATNLTDIQFATMLRQAQRKLNQAATNANIEVPPNFAWGFSSYEKTKPKPAEAVPLGRQLLIVEKLADILIASKVEQIREVHRAPALEGEAVGTDALPNEVPFKDPDGTYETMPVELQLACTAAQLRQLLNALSTSEWFFLVQKLDISSETLVVAEPVPVTPAPGTPVARPPYPVAPVNPAATEPKEPKTRTRLVVTIQLGLVQFLEPVAPTVAEAKPPA